MILGTVHSRTRLRSGSRAYGTLLNYAMCVTIVCPSDVLRPEFHHETMSIQLFEHLIDDNSLDIDKEDIDFIAQLVSGKYDAYCILTFF